MSAVNLMVLYPQPKDLSKFKQDYQAHLELFHHKMAIPLTEKPYSITTMLDPAKSKAAFYQIFSMPFPSLEALNQVMSSEAMQLVAQDASRISSGGEPVVLIGAVQ